MNAAMSTSVSNQIFDWGRFTAALRKELVENKRQLLLIVVSIFLFFTVFMVVGNLISSSIAPKAVNDPEGQQVIDLMPAIVVMTCYSFIVMIVASLAFRPLREGDEPLFVLQSPYGPLGAVPAEEGEETKVDLEMLFNATLQNPAAINQLFTTSK